MNYVLISSDFIGNCVKSKISPGIQSDHSVVSIHFNDNHPLRGKGYWKLNCHYLHHDAEFIKLIKEKKLHEESDCSPNTQWDNNNNNNNNSSYIAHNTAIASLCAGKEKMLGDRRREKGCT